MSEVEAQANGKYRREINVHFGNTIQNDVLFFKAWKFRRFSMLKKRSLILTIRTSIDKQLINDWDFEEWGLRESVFPEKNLMVIVISIQSTQIHVPCVCLTLFCVLINKRYFQSQFYSLQLQHYRWLHQHRSSHPEI